MQLWLMRHARPMVEEGLCYGAMDVEAHPEETLAAAQRLAQVLPPSLGVLVSPLKRCTRLAQALAEARPDLPVRTDARLAEMDFGGWEGQLWNALDRTELEAWRGDFLQYRAGRTGECTHDFIARVGRVLDESRAAGRDQAWIAHGGVFKAVLLHQSGVRAAAASDWPVPSLAWGHYHLFQIKD
jgi:alpha-ribazole phosphatase